MNAQLKRSATINSGLLSFVFAANTIGSAIAAANGSGVAAVFALIGVLATVSTVSDTINLYNSKV